MAASTQTWARVAATNVPPASYTAAYEAPAAPAMNPAASTATATATPAPARAAAHVAAPARPAAPAPAPTALYFGNLSAEVTEAMLYELLTEVVEVMSIRVCRDRITRQSLGYAYVNFVYPDQAEKVLTDLNFVPLLGRPVRIMRSQRNPELRKSNVGNIYIRGLDPGIDDRMLFHTFRQFGPILSSKVVYSPEGKALGYAFVHFQNKEDADRAIRDVNEKYLQGKKVHVEEYKPPADRPRQDVASTFTNVYVKPLAPTVNKFVLDGYFSEFGKIISSAVAMESDEHGNPTKCKGFGFVAFEDHHAAVAAVAATNDRIVPALSQDQKPLVCGRCQAKKERRQYVEQRRRQIAEERSGHVNLYMKNLPDSWGDEELKKYFENWAADIVSVKVMRDEHGNSRNFGFVCFRSEDSAQQAVEARNSHLLPNSKPLVISLAMQKEDRRHFLEQQRQQTYLRNYPAATFFNPPFATTPYMPRPVMMPGGMQQMRPPQQRGYPHMRPGGGGRQRHMAPPTAAGAAMQYPERPAPSAPVGQLRQLVEMTEEERRNFLGEKLYERVVQVDEKQAGKITGMLLELGDADVVNLLDDANALREKVHEAQVVLREAEADAGGETA